MTRNEIIAILKEDNPKARPDSLRIYADGVLDYIEAAENIAKNGAIVAHPRTGAPMDNPYLKVKAAAANVLQKTISIKNVSRIWENQ